MKRKVFRICDRRTNTKQVKEKQMKNLKISGRSIIWEGRTRIRWKQIQQEEKRQKQNEIV
jgi:hypothetical protein